MRPRLVGLVCACVLALVACGDGGGDPKAPASTTDLTLVQLNLLHGITGACRELDNCRLAERVELLFQLLQRSGCPDLVTLQEIAVASQPLIVARLGDACPFPYESAIASGLGVDDEMILSRYPIVNTGQQPLFPAFRRVFWARVDHPLGVVDVYATHLASSSDGAGVPCTERDCPPDCVAAGAANRRECQAVQVAAFVEATRDPGGLTVLAGDFNDEPGSFVYRIFTEHGWMDAYLAAGNPECDPAAEVGCTSGRDGNSLGDLESPASNVDERIDFVFVRPPDEPGRCDLVLDGPGDGDGDGIATRLFADEPNPFAPECGPAPAAICWPSDHQGVEIDLSCQ